MWYYYEILQRVTLETIATGKVWAKSADEAQIIANSRMEIGYVASEVKILNDTTKLVS